MRAELLPHTDQWMQGDRFGTVITKDPEDGSVLLAMDVSKKRITAKAGDYKIVERDEPNGVAPLCNLYSSSDHYFPGSWVEYKKRQGQVVEWDSNERGTAIFVHFDDNGDLLMFV